LKINTKASKCVIDNYNTSWHGAPYSAAEHVNDPSFNKQRKRKKRKKGRQMKTKINREIFALILAFLIGFPATGLALGFLNADQSASGQGCANAFAATADDPSALWYNPAGITQLEGTQILSGIHLVAPSTKHTSTAGVKEETIGKIYPIPHMYFTKKINDKLAVGMGLNTPFGLGKEYRTDSFAAFVGHASQLALIQANPTVAYKVNDNVSVGVGVDLDYVSDMSMKSKIDLGAAYGLTPGTYIGDVKIKTDATAWGYNLGVLAKVNDNQKLGASYRSGIDLDLAGTYRISNIPAALGLGSAIKTNAQATIPLPAMIKAGYAIDVNDKLSLEFDVDWLDYSSFKHTNITLEALPDVPNPRNWKDSYIYALGADYQLKKDLELRAGFAYATTPVPESTYEQIIPCNDMYVSTLGVGFEKGPYTIDVGYTLVLYNERSIDNNVGSAVGVSIDGDFDSIVHIFGVSVQLSI